MLSKFGMQERDLEVVAAFRCTRCFGDLKDETNWTGGDGRRV